MVAWKLMKGSKRTRRRWVPGHCSGLGERGRCLRQRKQRGWCLDVFLEDATKHGEIAWGRQNKRYKRGQFPTFWNDGVICEMGKHGRRANLLGKGDGFLSRHPGSEIPATHSVGHGCPERKHSQPPTLVSYLFWLFLCKDDTAKKEKLAFCDIAPSTTKKQCTLKMLHDCKGAAW